MKKLFSVVFLAVVFNFCGCSESGTGGDTGPEPPPPDFPLASLASMQSADISNIEKTHCEKYAEASTNSTAAFGCLMAKAAKFVESSAITALLADLGEENFNVQEDIFSKTNSASLCTKLAVQSDGKYWKQFPKLPFNELDLEDMSPTQVFKEMTKRLKTNGVSLTQLKGHLKAVDNADFAELVNLLNAARADAAFSFVIPKEMCQVDENVTIKKIDLEGFYAILGSIKLFVNLIDSYDLGLDLNLIVKTDGSIDKVKFKDDANGVGGDGKKFAELVAGKADFSAFKSEFSNVLNSIITLIDSIKTKQDSKVFGDMVTDNYKSFFQKLVKTAKDLKASLANPGKMTPMTNLGYPDVKLNINQFFTALPDPKAVKNSDPFVISTWSTGYKELQAVSQFFETLLSGIASF